MPYSPMTCVVSATIRCNFQNMETGEFVFHADTSVHPDLLSSRFGYVAVSRASHEATIFTDDVVRLGQQLSTEASKTSALEISHAPAVHPSVGIDL